MANKVIFQIEGDASKAVKAIGEVVSNLNRYGQQMKEISARTAAANQKSGASVNNLEYDWAKLIERVKDYVSTVRAMRTSGMQDQRTLDGLGRGIFLLEKIKSKWNQARDAASLYVAKARAAAVGGMGDVNALSGVGVSGAAKTLGAVINKFAELNSRASKFSTVATAAFTSATAKVKAFTGGVMGAIPALMSLASQASSFGQKLGSGLTKGFPQMMDNIGKFTDKFRQAFMNINDWLRMTTQAITNTGRSLMFFVTIPVAAFLTKMTNSAIDFEDQMVKISRTTGLVGKEFEWLRDKLREVARNSSASHSDLARITVLLGQMGVEAPESLARLTVAFDRYALGTDQSAEVATDAMGRIANAFGWVLEDSEDSVWRLMNVTNLLGKKTAANAEEIQKALTDFAPYAHMIGMVSAENRKGAASAAAFAATLPSLGLSADEAGTALRNMSIYVARNSEKVSEAMKAVSNAYSTPEKVIKAMEEDAVKVFVDIVKAASEGNNQIESMLALMEISDMRGGRGLAALAGNAGMLEENLRMANSEWEKAASLMLDYERAMSSTKSQMGLLRNNINDMGITIGDALLPTINKIIQVLVPAIRTLGNAFKNLEPKMQMTIMAAVLLGLAAGPLLMFFGQIFHAVTLLVMGFGQLIRVFPLVLGAIGKLGVVAGTAMKFFLGWPGLILIAVTGVLKVLSSMGVDIAGFFTDLAARAVAWGENLARSLADGFLAGAVRFITQAIAKVANLIASFFEAHSPPDKGPLSTINKWGSKLMETYLRGFRNADFSILSDVGRIIETILTRGIKDEALPGALKQVARARELIANLVSKFNETGVIDESLLNQATSGLGYMADKVKELVRLWLKYNQIQERLKQIEDLRKGAIKSYTKELAAIGASNMSIEDKIKAIRASQRARDDSLRGLSEEEEALKEQSDEYKEQLDYQKQLIGALNDQDDLLARIAAAIESLADKLKGIGGGGGELGFGKAEEEIEKAKSAMNGMVEQLDNIIDRFSTGRDQLQGFFDGFNDAPRKKFMEYDPGTGWVKVDTETQEVYDILYDLGQKVDAVRDNLVEIGNTAATAFFSAKEAFNNLRETVGQGLEPDEGASMPTSKAPSILDNIVQGFEAAKPIQTFFLSLAASMGIAKRAFTAVFDSLDRGFKTINKNADSKTILEGIANVLWFIGILAGGVANGFSFLVGIIVSVLSIIASSIAWVIGVIIGLGSIIWEALSGIGQAIADGFVNGWDSFKTKSQDAAAKAINDLIDFFKSLLGISSPSTVFDEFGKDTIQGFIDGIVSRASDLIENFKALFIGPNGIITWALSEETRNEILAIGKNIVGSIQSGIEEKWEEFKSWLKKKIDALPDWLKEFLNMGSPSKIMMEIGRDTMAGFIIGFQEAGKGIEQMFADSALGADLMRNLTSPVSVPVNLRPALGSLSAFPDFGDGPYMVQVVLNDPVVREESDIKRLSKAVADELQKTSYKRVKFGGHINS